MKDGAEKIPGTGELLNFSGKVVLVTGAGRGIGAGIAARFAEAGAALAVSYRTSEAGALRVVENARALRRRALAIRADVCRQREVEDLIAATVKSFGGLDILINNAGTYPLASLLEIKVEDWESVLNTNLRSVHFCTQAAARQMIDQGRGGAVINIASIEAEDPAPRHSHYNAAKGGVVMYTRAAALELGRYDIRVNAVSPGLIWSPGIEESWPDGVDRYRRSAPLGRLGMPEDIADACLFLASPAARCITGVNLRVDGGMGVSPGY
jgi:NAD(P)-dependent dehydrogenase (short-subunit alcohol dehydrogenase family)